MRTRLSEIPEDTKVVVHCYVGYRSYVAQRILLNAGRTNVFNVQGGFLNITRVREARALRVGGAKQQ